MVSVYCSNLFIASAAVSMTKMGCYGLVSWTRSLPSPALDVLHHQQGEGSVWPLWHSFRGIGWNVDMTNDI